MVFTMTARRNVLLVLACLSLAGCAGSGSTAPGAPGASGGGKGGGRRGGGGGDVPVTVVKVERKDVPVDIQVIGNVEAYSAIAVKAQVGGVLNKVHFQEGDYVKEGDLLFTIDARQLQAQLQQLVANQARNTAQLRQAEANLARDIAQEQYAQAQANRYARLMQEGVISKEQSEQTRTNADAVAQGVSADRAAIESVKADTGAIEASIENIKLQLNYTEIRSPIDGRTGNVAVKQGNVVNANTVDMMTINQVQPIYVTFSVPESQLGIVKKYMAVGKLPVSVIPQDDESSRESGVLTFVDNNVDMTTGTIKLKGTFPNADRKLWPGQFVRVSLRLTTQSNALVVPNQAVQTGQAGEFVFVVKADRTVESRPVTTGVRTEQSLVVDKGLEFGETVVTEGQLRLAPGSRVAVRDNSRGGRGGKGGPPS
jgi:membrane fusion protein, multidrug efflux system